MECGNRAEQGSQTILGSIYPYLGVIPLLLLIAAIAILHIFLSETPFARTQFNPPLLLPLLNTVFLFLIAGIVALISARSYLISGSLPILLLGVGVLTIGSGAFAAGWLRNGFGGINASMTVINTSFFISSIFHATGTALNVRERMPETKPGRRRRILAGAYSGALVLVVLIIIASLAGIFPLFFIHGKGPTPLRQTILFLAFLLFSASSLSMMMRFHEKKVPFLYWYALGLASLAVAMGGLFLIKVFGNPITWAGRIAQYLAGIYFLSAVLSAFRDARARGATLDEVVAELFQAPGIYWHNVLATVSDAIISIDQKGRILQWNQAAEAIFGYSRSEAMGKDITLIMCEHLGMDGLHVQLGGVTEMKLKRKDGSLFDAEVSTSKATLSREIITHVVRDVTVRKQAEQALQRNEATLRGILNAVKESILVFRPDGIVIMSNETALARLKIADDTMIGKHSTEFLPPDLAASRLARLRETVESARHVEYEDERAGIFFQNSLYPILDDKGCVTSVASFSRDITERKRTEEALRMHHEHLEKLVQLRTVELEARNEQLEKEIAERRQAEEEKKSLENQLLQAHKIDALGRFAGGIAHDLNNILYPIVINTETLLQEAQAGTDEHEMLKQTLDAAYRQRDLVKQILSFSRHGAQKLQPVKVAPLVEETLNFIRSTLPSTIELRRTINAPTGTIMGDPTQIQQVIMNLCKNAADALEVERGAIEVSLDAVHLDLDSAQPEIPAGEYLAIQITDTGHGIPPKVLDRIFEPFFTTKRVGKGTGMGLSVVHGILKRHGGCIKVASKEGEGSRFSFYLPLNKTPEN